MFFKKDKKMVDVRDLQRRGIVKIQKEEPKKVVVMDRQGFVDVTPSSHGSSSTKGSSLGFFSRKVAASPSSQGSSFSSEDGGYSKKEVDQKMVELDNKLYKLEQRIELLERKAGVGSGGNSGLIGW